MYIIIVGGGNVGTFLAKKLIANQHEALILEKDPTQFEYLQVVFDSAVALGDGCEALVQQRVGFGRADVVAAVTGEDEDNLIICQMAKHRWGVERTIARVNNPNHVDLFQQLNIDGVVSATNIIYNLIEQEIMIGNVIPLAALKRGNFELVEATITHRSKSADKFVKDLPLPPKSNILWLSREDETYLVGGDTKLTPGDLIVALVPTEYEAQLRDIL